jgi:phage-related protein
MNTKLSKKISRAEEPDVRRSTIAVYNSARSAARPLWDNSATLMVMIELRRWKIDEKEQLATAEEFSHPLFFNFESGGTASCLVQRSAEMVRDFTQRPGLSWTGGLTFTLEPPFSDGAHMAFMGVQPTDWTADSIFVPDTFASAISRVHGWHIMLDFERVNPDSLNSAKVLKRITVTHEPLNHPHLQQFLKRHGEARVTDMLLPTSTMIKKEFMQRDAAATLAQHKKDNDIGLFVGNGVLFDDIDNAEIAEKDNQVEDIDDDNDDKTTPVKKTPAAAAAAAAAVISIDDKEDAGNDDDNKEVSTTSSSSLSSSPESYHFAWDNASAMQRKEMMRAFKAAGATTAETATTDDTKTSRRAADQSKRKRTLQDRENPQQPVALHQLFS